MATHVRHGSARQVACLSFSATSLSGNKVALRRPRSAADRAPGCLEPRPASANQPLGPHSPATSIGHIGCGFHMGTSSEGRAKQFESQLVIELKLTTIALSMASVCARPLQTGSSVAVCASRLTPLGDCELGGERLGLAGELELGLVGVGE